MVWPDKLFVEGKKRFYLSNKTREVLLREKVNGKLITIRVEEDGRFTPKEEYKEAIDLIKSAAFAIDVVIREEKL